MPATISRIPGFQLQHLQPRLIQATFETTFSSPTVPTSPCELVLLTTEPCPQMTTVIPVSITGTNLYKTKSSHSSLYQKSRSPSLDPLPPIDLPGKTSMSDISHPPEPTCHSTDSENWSGSEGGQVRQATQTLPQSYSLRQSMSMESTEKVPSRPPSR